MASATFTWKHVSPFASIGGRIAEILSRLASLLTRGRGETDDERAISAGAAPAVAQDGQNEQDKLAQAIAHLEYLGYQVGPPDPDGWSYARHPLRYNFHLRAFPWGIRLHCGVGLGMEAADSRAEWLAYLNTANEQGHITRFSLRVDPSGAPGVRMCAFASGPYNRAAFAILMDMWHDDVDRIRRKPDFVPAKAAADDDETVAVTVH